MIYSVWNQADRVYDYYQTPERDEATSAPKPAHLRPATLGLSPEQAAWPLPSGARLTGHGKYPKGRIATKNGNTALGIIPIDLSVSNVVLLGALGWVLYHYVRKKR